MSHPDLRSYLAALPKIELHRHLEGAIRLQTLVEVAREHDLDLPARSAEGLRAHVQITPADTLDSVHFLSKFAILRRFFVSPEVIKRVAREAVADAARDNIRYMELRFTPKALAKLMNYPFDEVVRWVADAVREEQAKHPIQVRLIVAVNRHESIGEAERQIVAAVAHRRDGVVGVDLCGQEVGFSAAPFLPIFREAHQDGLGITIHAGEWDTAHNIGYAIEHIGASRIGHGVRVLENSSVVMMARLVGVTFEVCPTSNLQSGVIKQIERHPIREMMEIGLRTTLNTDDPAISNITLTDEYHTAIERLGITIENVRQAVRHAAEASFLPMLERERLAVEIDSTIAGVPVVSNR